MFKYDLNEQMKNIRFGVCTLAVLKKERIIKKSKLSTAESLFLEEKQQVSTSGLIRSTVAISNKGTQRLIYLKGK